MCCGQKRAQATTTVRAAAPAPRREPAARPAPSQPASSRPAPAPPGLLAVTVRSRNRSPMVVRGPITGRRYEFTGAGSTQSIDRRDAESLTATGLFERVV